MLQADLINQFYQGKMKDYVKCLNVSQRYYSNNYFRLTIFHCHFFTRSVPNHILDCELCKNCNWPLMYSFTFSNLSDVNNWQTLWILFWRLIDIFFFQCKFSFPDFRIYVVVSQNHMICFNFSVAKKVQELIHISIFHYQLGHLAQKNLMAALWVFLVLMLSLFFSLTLIFKSSYLALNVFLFIEYLWKSWCPVNLSTVLVKI